MRLNSGTEIRVVRRVLLAGAILAATILITWAIVHYGEAFISGGTYRQPNAGSTAGAPPSSATAGFVFYAQPSALPEVRFTDGEGRNLSLANFRGQPIVLNIWATWCGPCRKEMPALERLQTVVGRSNLFVLPLSIDRQGASVVKRFYGELGLTALGIYVDTSGKVSRDLDTVGIPTTLLIDRDGGEVGREVGPTEWDSPEVVALIRQHLGLPPAPRGDQGN
jgi:thiol-disulfide isomerase/thioredoxin